MTVHVQSAPLGMYGGCGGEKRAAILVPPDGGPGANIDIDSSVEMGRRHMGLSSRTDYNLFDGILEPPHALETEFLKHRRGHLWKPICISISGRAKVSTQVHSAVALTHRDLFYRCGLYE